MLNNRFLKGVACAALVALQGCSAQYMITTVAGDGTQSFGGDGGAAASAQVDTPAGIGFRFSGAGYLLADQGNDALRAVDGAEDISTFANSSIITDPADVLEVSASVAYVVETSANRVVSLSGGVATVYAGGGSETSDGGPATNKQLIGPTSIAAIGTNVYIADPGRHRVAKVDAGGDMLTAAGTGTAGYDTNGAAILAKLNNPQGVDSNGVDILYIADTGNHRVRYVNGVSIFNLAGSGVQGSAITPGNPLTTQLDSPTDVAYDASTTNIFIADTGNHRILMISGGGSAIAVVAGTGSAGFNFDGDATLAQLNSPTKVQVSSSGRILVTDTNNHRVRELSLAPTTQPTAVPSGEPSGIPTSMPTTPTSMPSSEPTTPTAQPTSVPTSPSNMPTSAPSPAPSPEPTSVPTPVPTTAAPTATPTYEETVRKTCLTFHMADLFGDGWGPYITLDADVDGNVTSTPLECGCNSVELCYEHYMNVSVASSVQPAVHTWEVLWTVELENGTYYGDYDTYMQFSHKNGTDVAMVFDEVDDSRAAKDNHCHRCHHPRPKARPGKAGKADDDHDHHRALKPKHGPPPPVPVPFKLKDGGSDGWFNVDDNATDICPDTGMENPMYPTVLTYPKYYIITKDRTKVLHSASLCGHASAEEVCEERLPSEGEFIWRVAGFEAEKGDSTWEFCGKKGGVGDELLFRMKHGKCESIAQFSSGDYCGGITTLSHVSGSFTLLGARAALSEAELIVLEEQVAAVLHADYVSVSKVTRDGNNLQVMFTGVIPMEGNGYHGLLDESEGFLSHESYELDRSFSNGYMLSALGNKLLGSESALVHLSGARLDSLQVDGLTYSLVAEEEAKKAMAPVEIVHDTQTHSSAYDGHVLPGVSNVVTSFGFVMVCAALFAGLAKFYSSSEQHRYEPALDESTPPEPKDEDEADVEMAAVDSAAVKMPVLHRKPAEPQSQANFKTAKYAFRNF